MPPDPHQEGDFCPSFLPGNVSLRCHQSFLIYCLNRCIVQERTKRGFTLFLKKRRRTREGRMNDVVIAL